jgi:hypothetical protein
LKNLSSIGIAGLICVAFSASACAQTKWNVTRTKDEMTGLMEVRACASSLNSTSQDFPYNRGATVAKLCLFKDKQDKESLVTLNQGQLMCALGGSTFMLKIDDAEPIDHRCVGTTSNRSDAGYFSNGEDSTNAIASAEKMIRIQVTLFNHGSVVFRFPPLGKTLQKQFQNPDASRLEVIK